MVNPAKAALEFKDPGKYAPDMNPESLGYFMASAPSYANGTLFVGLASSEGMIAGGLVVALDGAAGKVTWVFRTVPQGPGDDGWEIVKDTMARTPGTNPLPQPIATLVALTLQMSRAGSAA